MSTNILIDALGAATILSLTSVWVFGVNTLFQEDMILERWGRWMDERFHLWVNKPLWRCPPCMASVHGSIVYFLVFFPDFGFLGWLPFVVCLSGLNRVVNDAIQ